jgi:hypothetical protein
MNFMCSMPFSQGLSYKKDCRSLFRWLNSCGTKPQKLLCKSKSVFFETQKSTKETKVTKVTKVPAFGETVRC